MKVDKKYSAYQVDKAINSDIKQISPNCFQVESKYTVIRNNTKNFRCDCKWANDNKLHVKYCSHILGVLFHLDKKDFWEHIDSHNNE